MKQLTFIDIFCGIGTIRMGMEQAGHKCVYSIEWDKHKRKIYSIIFGGEPEGADIRSTQPNDIPGADCWCFGFPCQDISVAGKGLGLAGERSGLFYEVCRLLQGKKEEDKPRLLFIENVKNLLSINSGWDFFNLLYTLDEIGYDAEWQLLNSRAFGVPQNRERVFIIGHLRGKHTRKVFPIGKNDELDKRSTKRSTVIVQREAGRMRAREKDYVMGLTAKGNAGNAGIPLILTQDRAKLRIHKTENEVPCLKKRMGTGGNNVPFIYQRSRGNNQGGRHDIAPTVTKNGYEHNNHLLDGNRIRRLTPKEAWRLQGISDELTDKVMLHGISDTQMYRGAGDACTVPVIYEIASRLS